MVVAGGSFWGGTYYAEWNRRNQMQQFFQSGGQGQPPGMSNGQAPGMSGNNQQGGPGGQLRGEMGITGKVDRVDGESITITTRMGSQKITLTSDAKVNKPSSGSLDDIKKGTEIFVQGKRDTDGEMEAKTIIIIK